MAQSKMLLTIILPLLIVFILFLLCKQIIKGHNLYQHMSKTPDFIRYNVPLMGIFWAFMQMDRMGIKGMEVTKAVMNHLKTMPYSATGVVSIWGGNYLYPIVWICTSRTEILKALLNNKQRVDKSFGYFLLHDTLGLGLVTADKTKWAKHRKLLNPTFHQAMLQNFIPLMSLQSQQLVQKLSKQVASGPLVTNFTEMASEAVMAMLLETIIGAKSGDNFKEFREKAEIVDSMSFARMQSLIKLNSWTYWLTKEGRYYFGLCEFLRQETMKILLERISQLKKQDKDQNGNYLSDGRTPTIVDVLIFEHFKNPKVMTLDMIVDEVKTFLGAGWDTTTWTTSFTLQMVGTYPLIQEKIIQEIDSQLDGVTDDHILTMEDISKLKYLDCVINETLRCYPLINIFGRKITQDLEVEIDGQKRIFPAGVDFIIDSEFVHRNPKYWKDPDRFIPERFLPENSVGRDPLAFVPFSFGPRNCIGKTFAMCEEKVILAHIFRKFKVQAVDHIDKLDITHTGLVKRTKKPIKLIVQAR